VLLLVRELDLYIWNEKTFGYEIFEQLLKTIGKLPYYPNPSIKAGRIHPKDSKYRVGYLTGTGESLNRRIEVIDELIKTK
jgi:hypothetical protein